MARTLLIIVLVLSVMVATTTAKPYGNWIAGIWSANEVSQINRSKNSIIQK